MAGEETRFKPGHSRGSGGGQPGNQNARKVGVWKRALDAALERWARKHADDKYRDVADLRDRGLAAIADKVVEAAANGDKDSWQEIANRMDGKAKEHVELNVIRRAGDISDDELRDIACGGGDRAADEAERPQDPAGVH
jgi:hypothetical protein